MGHIPVFLYHHIHPDFHTPSDFEKEMRFLKDNGYITLTLTQLSDFICGKKEFEKAVVITFDDGYADNYVYAYPILKRYNFNAIVFLTTSYISSKEIRKNSDEGGSIGRITRENERDEDGFLRWAEIKKMFFDGVFEVGSHTHTHNNFNKSAEYKDLEYELKKSKEIIEKNLGLEIFSLAWPWGKFDNNSVEVAKRCGYKMLFTTITGPVKRGDDVLYIRRINVLPKRDFFWFKSRLHLYTTPILSDMYSKIYGVDRKILKFFKR